MTYEQKGRWVYLVVILGAYGTYVAVVVGRSRTGALADVAYVAPMLWSIGIAIALSIVGRIVVEIARPSGPQMVDVRDKEINRSGEYFAGLVLAVAMVVPLGLTLARAGHFWIANTMYAAYVVSTVVGTVAKLVAYRRGL
jgi:hypothetical protein